MKRYAFLFATLLLLAATPASLQIDGAWVRESNPARNVTSAYMTLSNPTAKAIVITAVTSPAAKVVEMHEMKTIDGVMSMRKVDTIVVPPRSSVKLEPGGMHLMLIGLESQARAGNEVTFTFQLNDGSKVSVAAAVKNPDAAAHHAH